MSAFPPQLPANLDDPAIIHHHDWQAFRDLDVMHSHWQRPGWSPGRRSFHWLLSLHDAPSLRRLTTHCQADIVDSSFDLVPLDALHLTLDRIAFTDQVTEATVRTIATRARSRLTSSPAFELAAGPLAGSRGALRYSVAPWRPLLALHAMLTEATRYVLGARAIMNTDQFRPHVSIAYANTTVPVGPLLPTMKRLRGLPTADLTVSFISLVELRREDRTYRYVELERIGLHG